MSPIEITAFLTGVATVWLAARQNIWNWPIGIVNVSLYAVLFWEARLYADAGLQVVYLILAVYGWWAWLYGGAQHTPLAVQRASPRLLLGLGAAGAAFAAGLGMVLARFTDAAVPIIDSSLTAASLVAQFLMTRKYLENWPLWVAADIVYVGLFINRGLYLTAAMYAIFMGIAAYAWREWYRSWVADRVKGVALPPRVPAGIAQ